MAYIYPSGKKREKLPLDQELLSLSKELDDFEVLVTRIKKTSDSGRKKYEKLENLYDQIYLFLPSIKKSKYLKNSPDISRIENTLKRYKRDRTIKVQEYPKKINWKKLDSALTIQGMIGGGTAIGLIVSGLHNYLLNNTSTEIALITFMSIATAPIYVPDLVYFSYVYKKNRSFRKKYEKKLIENSKKIIKHSKTFLDDSRKKLGLNV